MEKTELQALISLLDDPDEAIFQQLKSKLIDFGDQVIPVLEEAWEDASYDEVYHKRIESIIHTIQFQKVKSALTVWKQSAEKDLLEGILILSRYQYPDLDRTFIDTLLQTMERDIWLEFNANLTALEKVRIINHVLFDVHGFGGNSENYHSVYNSYINTVFESRKGTPLSLSVIYMVLAQRLKLPIYGVNLPRHFILAYQDIPFLADSNPQVLFYINPFSKGVVLLKREVQHFLKQLKIEEKDEYFLPCSTAEILIRVLNNLIYSYSLEKEVKKVEELNNLLVIIQNSNG